MSRPSLGHRSISEQAPLYNPSAAPNAGSRLRGSKAASGAQTGTGSVLPYSPLLPLPPISSSKHPTLDVALNDSEQGENLAPPPFFGQRSGPVCPSALATRRQARRGVSEGFAFHSQHGKSTRAPGPGLALGPKVALRLDITAASDMSGQPAASKSAGMIRSYSLPVATQEEHDEQQRIMALGLSPVGHYTGNPAWWQYGWPSPGGVNHRHLQRPAMPEFLGECRRPSQSKLSSVMTPAMVNASAAAAEMGPSPLSGSPAGSRPSSRSSKTRSSCSPKMKNKHLPSIHQHTLQQSSSRSAASPSPKMGRSPLSMISTNLPSIDQQHEQELACGNSDHGKSVDVETETPAEAAFDIEMDALNQRFAEWSRSQAMSSQAAVGNAASTTEADVDEDYFNLVHDQVDEDAIPATRFLGPAGRRGGSSDTSDEARTPRASSPRPLSKASLLQHHCADLHESHSPDSAGFSANRWSGNFDFIHPDHLT